jgi:hypothetical protein
MAFTPCYTLKAHLKQICDENPQFGNLWATWELNQKAFSEMLNNIVRTYPHYSMHDSNHSETIISNIEMLLGVERIKALSPTDVWLLLNSAYAHDIGMVLLHSDVQKLWSEGAFQDFIVGEKNSNDAYLRQAIAYIEKIESNRLERIDDLSWPLSVSDYTTYIISCYFRNKHAEFSQQYISKMHEKWSLDLGHNKLISDRLIHVLGEISFMHTRNPIDLLSIDYKANGFCTDYMHPRFVAELLRFGDLLDADGNRFNKYTELSCGISSESSAIHKQKHQSTRHILITPDVIEFTANCPDNEVYREVRRWLTWLESETEFFALHWTEIVPQGFVGHAPKLCKKELLLSGFPDEFGTTDLRFEISQEKAFDIIEGSNVYKEKYIFVREFVQNAIDAVKIQMWRDLKHGVHIEFRNKPISELSRLMPFEIPPNVFECYVVSVKIETLSSVQTKVTISDNGTGISIETLKMMCKAGDSYATRKALTREIREMPPWLRPTGGFGIGLQSAFLVTDTFEIQTNSDDGNPLRITLESRKSDGYIQVSELNESIPRGTQMIVLLENESNLTFNFGGNVDRFFSQQFDPITEDKSPMTALKVLDVFSGNCESSMFNINVACNGESTPIERISLYEELREKGKENLDYVYLISESLSSITLWTKPESVFATVYLSSGKSMRNEYFFKGMKVDKGAHYQTYFHEFKIDMHGFETKGNLALSRDEFTLECQKHISPIIDRVVKFAIEILKQEVDLRGEFGMCKLLREQKDCQAIKEREKFHCIDFLLACKLFFDDFDISDYKYMFDFIDRKIRLLRLNNDRYNIEEVAFSEIANKFPELFFVNTEGNPDPWRNSSEDYEIKVTQLINDSKQIFQGEDIVFDTELISAFRIFRISEVHMLRFDISNSHGYRVEKTTKNEKCSVIVDSKTERYILRCMSSKNNRGFRAVIPSIENYDVLAVTHYYGHFMSSSFGTHYGINSPMTSEDSKHVRMMKKEAFVDGITSREDFSRLIAFTVENHAPCSSGNEDAIRECYIKLIGDYYDIMNDPKSEDIIQDAGDLEEIN